MLCDDDLKEEFERDGYVILSSFFDERQISELVEDLEEHAYRKPSSELVVDNLATGERGRLIDVGPDVVRAGRFKVSDVYLESEVVRRAALANGLDRILSGLMGQPPVLCNSLFFERGSTQPLHVDSLYMTPQTRGDLLAIWIALEDVNDDAGPLSYVPGSHVIPPFEFSSGGRHHVPSEMPQWRAYIEAEIERRGLSTRSFAAKAGDVLVWHSQLIHGGGRIRDRRATRRSLVFHYYSLRDCKALRTTNRRLGHAYWMDRPHALVSPPEEDVEVDAPFDEASYLARYPDVASAVKSGQFESGLQHYELFGRREGRRS